MNKPPHIVYVNVGDSEAIYNGCMIFLGILAGAAISFGIFGIKLGIEKLFR